LISDSRGSSIDWKIKAPRVQSKGTLSVLFANPILQKKKM
jgi:hypothetical protein